MLQSKSKCEPQAQKDLDAYITLHFPDDNISIRCRSRAGSEGEYLENYTTFERTFPNFLWAIYRA
ncbi:hypothetical protein ACFOUP_12745 [Belliella kenyensis]|uniref:Uncharacterized protein n=1 Tax=Belliella kenyensis TaxID=1472724 RepID=A0ABV8ELP2_9BACT|nr:hypothetical protein [Belliella kenyensis]MCH7400842.1 hypothetical protein [Belliella kenyensis]MDN3601870.1 hypothetical protein [Belliella kenyensis]